MSLETEYKNRTHGEGHFFDGDTMRFFKSRIGNIKVKDNIWYFVTSEKSPYGRRMYSVREMGLDGRIKTIGEFCSLTSYQANKLLKQLVGG